MTETGRYCGAWHNPDGHGIGDANCARDPGHAGPHVGMGGNPRWSDPDPKDAVIARLLDGWSACTEEDAGKHWYRFLPYGPNGRDEVTAEMSDGEAAIIRAHQEQSA